jgi:nucleotide-binding universal stress UspA family protein
MVPIRTILHPTDFSYCARYAFDLASALAKDYGARLVVLHVHAPEVQAFGVLPPMPPVPVEDRSELVARLRDLRPRDSEVPVDYFLRDGAVAAEIVRLAREVSCDLIVMGSHGRTGMSRLLMGGVAEEVSRKAPCPVLTVKGPPRGTSRSGVGVRGTGPHLIADAVGGVRQGSGAAPGAEPADSPPSNGGPWQAVGRPEVLAGQRLVCGRPTVRQVVTPPAGHWFAPD